MNKRDFNVVGNEGTDNQELAKGIAFIKSRRAELNVVQVCIVPLSTKLKDNPVHVKLNPEDVKGYKLKAKSDFIPEDMQTVSKGKIRGKIGYIPKDSPVRDNIDRSLILQLDLLSAARKMIMEEVENGCENEEN